MQDLSITSNLNAGTFEMILSGSLNEAADFSKINVMGTQQMYIDFNGITFINSTGINKWVKWMNVLEEDHKSIKINFCNCPKIIIDQINAVKGFLPKNAIVESFFIPFYCEESDRREFVLMTRGKSFKEESPSEKDWIQVPECNCSQTNTPCELDVMPAKYFSFLKMKK